MERAIAKEHALLGAKLQLAIIIGTKVWPTGATKNLKKGIIRNFTQ
jgi:hypothetical protein